MSEADAEVKWRGELTRIHEWDADKLEELILYAEEFARVCAAFDEERLVELHGINPIAWRRIALTYCTFAQARFPFERCDAIAACLLVVFELGDVEVKAAAIMALAMLGFPITTAGSR